MRIVTLLPSATDIVCALGLGEFLVGVSHSCAAASLPADMPRMTSTRVPYRDDSKTIDSFVRNHLDANDALYDLDMSELRAARPDFVVSQALCDVCAVSTGDVESALCSLPSRPTLIDLQPHTLEDVFDDIMRVGVHLDARDSARKLLASLKERVALVAERTARIPSNKRPRVAFLEWLEPPFNGGHWNPELVALAGGIDLLGAAGKPSSTLSWPAVASSRPDVLFIACCGFPIDRTLKDVEVISQYDEWQKLPAVQDGRVYIADGNDYFACPGPKLIDSLEILGNALHPDHHPGPDAGPCLQLG